MWPQGNVYYQPHRSYHARLLRTESLVLGFSRPGVGIIRAEEALTPADSSPMPLSPTSVWFSRCLQLMSQQCRLSCTGNAHDGPLTCSRVPFRLRIFKSAISLATSFLHAFVGVNLCRGDGVENV